MLLLGKRSESQVRYERSWLMNAPLRSGFKSLAISSLTDDTIVCPLPDSYLDFGVRWLQIISSCCGKWFFLNFRNCCVIKFSHKASGEITQDHSGVGCHSVILAGDNRGRECFWDKVERRKSWGAGLWVSFGLPVVTQEGLATWLAWGLAKDKIFASKCVGMLNCWSIHQRAWAGGVFRRKMCSCRDKPESLTGV